ncbi:hypothetical protein [Caloranaerobacter sp. DY30410]
MSKDEVEKIFSDMEKEYRRKSNFSSIKPQDIQKALDISSIINGKL